MVWMFTTSLLRRDDPHSEVHHVPLGMAVQDAESCSTRIAICLGSSFPEHPSWNVNKLPYSGTLYLCEMVSRLQYKMTRMHPCVGNHGLA